MVVINENTIEGLCRDFFHENPDMFLVSIKISNSNNIHIKIDSDTGVTIDKCVELNRLIESKLDRNEEDFSIEVSSYDLNSPLTLERQYKKNEGKYLKITTKDGKEYIGLLDRYNAESQEFSLMVENSLNKIKLIDTKKINVHLRF